MHSRQGLDGAEVVLQLGHELLLASQGGHGLGQLDLQLGTAHCKTEPGLSPGGGPKPQTVPRGHQRAEKPPPGAAKPTQSSDPVLSSCLGAAGHQQSLLSTRVQPSLVMPQGGHSPQDGAVPRPSARDNGSRQLPALAQLLQSISKVFLVPRGTWQHPGWAEQGDLERDEGS